MRRETPENQQHHPSACYGSGTRVEVHRSRHELERVLNRYGADEVLFVEADANAAIQFAMHGRYVQLALPLPDPGDPRFTRTPSGKPRTATAQDRAYDQALREHWRSLLVAVRGKLQSVESGISTFEQEFDRFLIPHFAEEKRRNRKTPKAVKWLLGGSHSLAIALVAAFLVPASAVGAFALPTNVVGHLAAPFRSAAADGSASGGQADGGLALARGGWSPSHGTAGSTDAGHLVALRSQESTDGQLRRPAALTSPPVEPVDVPAAAPSLASVNTTPISTDDGPAAPPSPPAPPADGPRSAPTPPPDDPPVVPPADDSDVPAADEPASGDPTLPGPTDVSTDETPVSDPSTTDSSLSGDESSGDGASTDAPPSSGDPSPGNGNGNANGQENGNANGQGNGNGNGNGNGDANGQANGQGNGNANGQGNGNANGQANGQGNGNAQGNGKAVGNGKGKGGK